MAGPAVRCSSGAAAAASCASAACWCRRAAPSWPWWAWGHAAVVVDVALVELGEADGERDRQLHRLGRGVGPPCTRAHCAIFGTNVRVSRRDPWQRLGMFASWLARVTRTSASAIREALELGWRGYHEGAVCPYPHGPLGEAWRRGWDEAEDFEERAW